LKIKGTNMTYAYLRVSTDAQDAENQRSGVDAKAVSLGLTIDKYIIDDGISGTKEPEKRALGGLLQELHSGDILICSELSRLGRKLFMIMRVLEYIMNIGAKLYTVKEGYELGDNIQSKVLAFAFGLSAEIERTLISQRTKEALAHRKAIGVQLGRKHGVKNSQYKLDDHKQDIIEQLMHGFSKRQIYTRLHVTAATLDRFLLRNNIVY